MSIRVFQKNNGLHPDGVVGKQTVKKIKEVFNLTVTETAHFIAQCDHETGGFKYTKENLNYSADGLLRIFKKYFPTRQKAEEYKRQPEKIANKVYANRMGNGDEDSGDGWKYSGKGAIQLTGFNNYFKFAQYIDDLSILDFPNKVATDYYLDSAIWFFKTNRIFVHCDSVDEKNIKIVTRKINGGYNGLKHRMELTQKYYKILKQIERDEENRKDTDIDNSNISDSRVDNVERQKPENTQVRNKKSNRGYKVRFPNPFKRWLLP